MSDLNAQLIRTVIKGDRAGVEALLAQGAEVNITGGVTALGASNTALMWAAGEGYLAIVKLLLDRGAEVNAKNAANYTALMFAAESDYRDVVSVLLDRGATIHDRNQYNETILMSMSRRGQSDILPKLMLRIQRGLLQSFDLRVL